MVIRQLVDGKLVDVELAPVATARDDRAAMYAELFSEAD